MEVRDIAAAAIAALTSQGHAEKTYSLTGPKALFHAEMAAKLSDATGHSITFLDVTPDAMREALSRAPIPAWQADS